MKVNQRIVMYLMQLQDTQYNYLIKLLDQFKRDFCKMNQIVYKSNLYPKKRALAALT